jgi:MOSC domain-containing protein YiiM
MPGIVVAIYCADAAGEPPQPVAEARALPGRGLEGDRYFRRQGTFSQTSGGGREVTLIEIEALDALERDYAIRLEPSTARRNIVTRGIPLNHLVGREFSVGPVRLRGVRLCEPCTHLEKLSIKGVLRGLVHRGGLRADVVSEGTIRPGDAIAPLDTE